jgi:myo-inositol-1-phosphate synthase
MKSANYFGSFTQSSTTRVGMRVQKDKLEDVFMTIKDLVPLVNPNDIEITGWDISDMDLYDACKRAQVLEPSLLN